MLDTPKTTLEMRNLDDPDERRTPGKAVLDIVNLPGATIVRGTMQPGWKWSTDVAPVVGTDSCQVAHSGVVVSGCFHVRMEDGREFDLGPGDAHVVAPGHDAWVVGDEPVVVFDFATTGQVVTGHTLRCPCGVEFRVAGGDQLDHLVGAVQQHASASHGHELSAEEILAEVSAS